MVLKNKIKGEIHKQINKMEAKKRKENMKLRKEKKEI